jgi:hypothetical protein
MLPTTATPGLKLHSSKMLADAPLDVLAADEAKLADMGYKQVRCMAASLLGRVSSVQPAYISTWLGGLLSVHVAVNWSGMP